MTDKNLVNSFTDGVTNAAKTARDRVVAATEQAAETLAPIMDEQRQITPSSRFKGAAKVAAVGWKGGLKGIIAATITGAVVGEERADQAAKKVTDVTDQAISDAVDLAGNAISNVRGKLFPEQEIRPTGTPNRETASEEKPRSIKKGPS